MKKTFLLFCLALSGAAAWSAGISIELDARHSGIKMNQPAGMESRHPQNNDPKRIFYREFYTKENAGKEWKQYEISFMPDKSGGITFGLCSTFHKIPGKYEWIDYDKLEIVNARLFNPSFEEMSVKNQFYRWRYYTRQSQMTGQKDAADGKNYIRVTRVLPARQGISVIAGKKVTIRFMARSGGVSPIPGDKTFRSDQLAPSVLAKNTNPEPPVPARDIPRLRVALRGEPFFNVQMSKLSSSSNLDIARTKINGRETPYHVYAYSKKPVGDSWEKYSFTFTPSITGEIQLYLEGERLRSKKTVWVFFDKLEAKGTKILNPSFEKVQADFPARWSGDPNNLRKDMTDAPDGKCVAAVRFGSSLRQVISVVKNRPVTISFYARKGDEAEQKILSMRNKNIPNNYPVKYYRFYDKKTAKYLPFEDKGIPGDSVREQYSWIKPGTPPAVTIQYPVTSKKSGKLRSARIPFELLEENGIARTADVKFGFPFPRKGIYTIDKLAILGPDGNAVPAQFTAISFWPDRSIKFVQAEFKAKLKAKERSKWHLAVNSGKKAPALPVLKCFMTADGFEVDTGRLTAEISKRHFNFLKNLKVDGQKAGSFSAGGLVLVDEHRKVYTSSAAPLDKLYIEATGPLAITLRAEGKFDNDMGRFICRMTFRAGSPKVDFSIRYQNINLKNEFTDIRSLKFTFTPRKNAKHLRMEGTNCRRIFQMDDKTLKVDNRIFNRMMNDGGSAGNITYALRDAAERYPKAFSVEKGRLNFELLPALPSADFGKNLPFYLQFPFCGGCYRMKWGMGFTEEIKIDFSGKTRPAELAAMDIIPVVDAVWLYNTKVFPGLPNGKTNTFAGLDKEAIKAFRRHMQFKKQQREYGFLNWGDWYGERGRNWANNEYDLAHGLFMLYLRTGYRDAFRWAMTAARHQADVDIVHCYPDPCYVGANVQHSIGHTGQSSSNPSPAVWSKAYDNGSKGTNGHTWSEGMTEAWLLGGDIISMESALLLGEHLVNYTAPLLTRLTTHERSAGWSIPALLGIYRATGNRKYLNAAKMLVDVILDEQKFDLGGAWPHKLPADHANGYKDTYGNCPYLVGIVLQALQKYEEEAPSAAVRKSIIAAANWLHRGLDKSRYGWPYGMGYNGQHYWQPSQGLNLIIAPGMMTGGRLSNNKAIYDSALLITSCSVMTGVSHVGKSLSIRLCMLPVLFEEMNRFSARNPKAGKFKFIADELAKRLDNGIDGSFGMRGPDNMAFEVIASKPCELTITREPAGANPKPKPEFTVKVIGKDGKILFSAKDKIRAKGSWKVALPAKGRYMIEITDSCTGVWNARSKDCRIRTELRKGYHFVNSGIARQFLIIPAGVKEFTLEFFGTHEGACTAFLLDPRNNIAGTGTIVTSGMPRLPWFKGAETLPKGRIKIKLAKPYKKETAWKLIVFSVGNIRLDLTGTKGQIALSKN